MQKWTLGNVRLYAGGLELTGSSNKVDLAGQYDDKETTTWADVDPGGFLWKTLQATLGSGKVDVSGFWSAGDPSKVDDALWATQGAAMPWSVLPRSQGAGSAAAPAPGDLAWFLKGLQGKYQLGDQVGNVAPFAASASSSSPVVRGRILHQPGTPRTATGTGTAVQIGAVPAGRSLYAGLHLLSTADVAATLTVTVQSATDAAFTVPTTRGTFNGTQAISGQTVVVSGPVTDTYWRASWTVAGGVAPSFLFLVSAGIA